MLREPEAPYVDRWRTEAVIRESEAPYPYRWLTDPTSP